jgi:hypothetical protein
VFDTRSRQGKDNLVAGLAFARPPGGKTMYPTSSQPTALVQTFNGRGKPLQCLFALIVSEKLYNTISHIAGIVGCDRETAGMGLHRLSNLNLAVNTPHGWILTQNGKQLILSSPQFLLSPASGAPTPGAVRDPVAPSPDGVLPPGSSLTPDQGNHNCSSEDSECGILPHRCGKMPHLKEEEEVLKESIINPPLPPENSTCGILPHADPRSYVVEICAATGGLWEFPLQPNCADLFQDGNLTPEDLIAKIAEMHHVRSRYPHPASIVYIAMKTRNHLAPRKYYDHPGDYLPPEFLQAIGADCGNRQPTDRGGPRCTASEDCDRVDDVNGLERIVPDASLETLLPGCHFTPAQAWGSCIEELERQMERATFWRWVKEAQALRFELPNRLVIGAVDAQSRAWLEGRLTSTLRRMLGGWLGEVEVTFEVMP